MFKKAVKIGAQNQLSGKDRKTIKAKLSDNLDSECVEKIFASNDKIVSNKVSGSKMLIYLGNEYPIFVDGTGKHNYFPSLYVAAAYEPLLKVLQINEGVESYIFNGANLMWPGVRDYEGLGEFKKDEVIGIRSSKGELIAVGAMGCGKKDLQNKEGVAVYVLHYKGDKLWDMGPKAYPEVVVSAKTEEKLKEEIPEKQQTVLQKPAQQEQKGGKQQEKPTKKQQPTRKQSSEAQKKEQSEEESDSDDDDDFMMNIVHTKTAPKSRPIQMEKSNNIKNAFIEDVNTEKNAKNKKKGGKKGGAKKKNDFSDEDIMEEEPEEKPVAKDNKKDKKKGAKGKKGKKQQESGSEDEDKMEEEPKQEKSSIDSKLMDQYFKESMLNAIKLSKVEAELPIDSGRFYMDFMLLARSPGVKLDIKESTYKKIGKFFEDMSKKKFIEYKHQKDKKVQGALITKIFWENQELKDYLPTVKKLGSKEEEEKVQNYSKAKLKLSNTVHCDTVYKPSADLFEQVFKTPLNLMPDNSDDEVTDKQEIKYMTEEQIRQGIEKYINKISENAKDGKKMGKDVFIDYKKHKFISQLLKKEIEDYEENKEKDELLEPDSDEEDKKNKKKKNPKIKDMFKIDRSALFDKLMKKTSSSYHLYDKENDLDIFKEGTFKGIQIVVEKSNNKNITKVSGLESFITPRSEADDQLNGFANSLQTKFACSVNVQNLPGKNAGKEIIAHGAFLDEFVEIFEEQHDIPSRFVNTQNKLDKKKKH